MVGRTLAHCQILEKIGAGGMGVVYRARDTQLEHVVALKVVGEQAQVDENARAPLLREARTASALNHPNICTIYEAGVADGETYIAMELVEGQPLSAQKARQIITRWPLFWPAHLILGELLREQGDTVGAVREQERILEHDPNN